MFTNLLSVGCHAPPALFVRGPHTLMRGICVSLWCKHFRGVFEILLGPELDDAIFLDYFSVYRLDTESGSSRFLRARQRDAELKSIV